MFTAIVDFMNISIIIPNRPLTGNCLKFIGHVLRFAPKSTMSCK